MRKSFILVYVIFAAILVSCDKDSGKEINTLQITDGELSGYSHAFSPNMGFWSAVDETTRYIDFEGNLTGQFTDISDSSRKISFSMILSLPMQEI
jgi:hypothetical protein